MISAEAEKWLRELVDKCLSHGLSFRSAPISKAVCEELLPYINRAQGNDGDYPWHGRMVLDPDFAERLRVSFNVSGTIRSLIADDCEKS